MGIRKQNINNPFQDQSDIEKSFLYPNSIEGFTYYTIAWTWVENYAD